MAEKDEREKKDRSADDRTADFSVGPRQPGVVTVVMPIDSGSSGDRGGEEDRSGGTAGGKPKEEKR